MSVYSIKTAISTYRVIFKFFFSKIGKNLELWDRFIYERLSFHFVWTNVVAFLKPLTLYQILELGQSFTRPIDGLGELYLVLIAFIIPNIPRTKFPTPNDYFTALNWSFSRETGDENWKYSYSKWHKRWTNVRKCLIIYAGNTVRLNATKSWHILGYRHTAILRRHTRIDYTYDSL